MFGLYSFDNNSFFKSATGEPWLFKTKEEAMQIRRVLVIALLDNGIDMPFYELVDGEEIDEILKIEESA